MRIPVASLSGGQRQVVAIARSLIGEPSVVILDEPTAALGVAQTAEVLNLIERLRERGLGVILISHNIADVQAVADRIVVLRLGRNNGEFRRRRRHQRADHRRHHRRLRPRPRPHGREGLRVSNAIDLQDERLIQHTGLRGAVQEFGMRVRGGDLGSLPVVVGLVIICVVFQVLNPNFLSSANLVNITMQMAAVGTVALGVVLVLLLGEIDLSVGSVSGLAAAITAVTWVQLGWPLPLVLVLAIGAGCASDCCTACSAPGSGCRASSSPSPDCSACWASSCSCSATPGRSTSRTSGSSCNSGSSGSCRRGSHTRSS